MADKPGKATLLQVLRMVFSAFIGIGKRGEHVKIEVTPVQVIIVGIIAGAVFVGTIVSVVQLVTR